jgi:hypothetical protein
VVKDAGAKWPSKYALVSNGHAPALADDVCSPHRRPRHYRRLWRNLLPDLRSSYGDQSREVTRPLPVARKKTGTTSAKTTTARELMATGDDLAEVERDKRIAVLIPGLTRHACSHMKPARWPIHFVMTGILSPIPFKWTPLPSMIYYDWEGAGNLTALMHEARSTPPVLEFMSVLTRGVGYSVERLPNGRFACAAKSPGVVRPDWMSVAGCACKGRDRPQSGFRPERSQPDPRLSRHKPGPSRELELVHGGRPAHFVYRAGSDRKRLQCC